MVFLLGILLGFLVGVRVVEAHYEKEYGELVDNFSTLPKEYSELEYRDDFHHSEP